MSSNYQKEETCNESTTESKQIFIRLHLGRRNRDRSSHIFPSIYDGMGESGIIHGYGGK